MANHKSAEKRARQSEKRSSVNTKRKKAVKTVEKKLTSAIAKKDAKTATELYKAVASLVDRAAKNKVISKAHANRKKSRLASQISSLK